MSKHTPGPWTQDRRLVVAGDDAIAMVNIARPVDQAYADARLIAAAPDLLAAIYELIHAGALNVTTRDDARSETAKNNARAALAKAAP